GQDQARGGLALVERLGRMRQQVDPALQQPALAGAAGARAAVVRIRDAGVEGGREDRLATRQNDGRLIDDGDPPRRRHGYSRITRSGCRCCEWRVWLWLNAATHR